MVDNVPADQETCLVPSSNSRSADPVSNVLIGVESVCVDRGECTCMSDMMTWRHLR